MKKLLKRAGNTKVITYNGVKVCSVLRNEG